MLRVGALCRRAALRCSTLVGAAQTAAPVSAGGAKERLGCIASPPTLPPLVPLSRGFASGRKGGRTRGLGRGRSEPPQSGRKGGGQLGPEALAQRTQAIRACGRDWKKVLRLVKWGLHEQRDGIIALDDRYFTAAITVCQRAGKLVEAEQLLEEAGGAASKYMFSSLITGHANQGQWERALALMDEMPANGVAPNVVVYNAAISACEKGGQWERALALLDEMPARGVTPDVISYSAAISACEKGGQWERALALLDEMPAHGVTPDVILYNAAISACEKGGQWERALALLDEMPAHGVTPDVVSYSAAISACEKGGQWERALALLDEMPARGVMPGVITYNTAIEALFAASQHGACCRVYWEAVERGLYAQVWLSQTKIDLHSLSAAVACTVLSCLLHELCTTPSLAQTDFVVVTGKGLNSGAGGAVLMHATVAHLADVLGPRATEEPRNPGCFRLRKGDLAAWIKTAAVVRTPVK